MAFFCEIVREEKVLIIRANGYLDGIGGKELVKAVEEGFANGYQNFILNFSEAPVVNSQGVAMLLEVMEIILEKRKGKLAYVGLSELTKTFFKMAGLLVGTVYPSESTAMKGFS